MPVAVVIWFSIMADNTESNVVSTDFPSEEGRPPDDQTAEYPRAFYIKEFEILRKEIEWINQDSRTLERNVVIAIGVFWAFLIKESPTLRGLKNGYLAWIIPVVFAILGYVRALSLERNLHRLGKYIRKIERFIRTEYSQNETPEGWEGFQENLRKGRLASRFGWLVRIKWSSHILALQFSALAFWFILIIVTLSVAYFGSRQ